MFACTTWTGCGCWRLSASSSSTPSIPLISSAGTSKNAEKSMAVTVFIAFFAPWGMPFFFMMAGAGSWFALQRRTARLYLRERFTRLLIPFIAGSILLMPVMLYFEWRHGIWTGSLRDPFLQYALSREVDYRSEERRVGKEWRSRGG